MGYLDINIKDVERDINIINKEASGVSDRDKAYSSLAQHLLLMDEQEQNDVYKKVSEGCHNRLHSTCEVWKRTTEDIKNFEEGGVKPNDLAYSSLAQHLLGMNDKGKEDVYKVISKASMKSLCQVQETYETRLSEFQSMGLPQQEIKLLWGGISLEDERLKSLATNLQNTKKGGSELAKVLPIKQKMELFVALLDKDHSKKMFGKVQAGTVFLQSVCDELSEEKRPTLLRDALLDVLDKKPIEEADLEKMYDRLQPSACDAIAIAILDRDKSAIPLRGDSSGARFFRLHLRKSFGKDNQKQLVKLFVKESKKYKIGKEEQIDGWNVTGDFMNAAQPIVDKFCKDIQSSSSTKNFLLRMSQVIFKNHPGRAIGILLGILQIRYLNIAAVDAGVQSKDQMAPMMLGAFIAKAFSNIINDNGQFRGFAKDIPQAHAIFTKNILGAIGIPKEILEGELQKNKNAK